MTAPLADFDDDPLIDDRTPEQRDADLLAMDDRFESVSRAIAQRHNNEIVFDRDPAVQDALNRIDKWNMHNLGRCDPDCWVCAFIVAENEPQPDEITEPRCPYCDSVKIAPHRSFESTIHCEGCGHVFHDSEVVQP